jgi:hypothetical protein
MRDTRSKLKARIKFFGVEGGIYPVIISAALSAMLLSVAAQSGSIALSLLATTPFVLTFLYLLIFVTGRRPHFTRDLVCLVLNGKAVGPRPPPLQPLHPRKGCLKNSDKP